MNKSFTIDVWQNDKRANTSRTTTDALTTVRVVLPP
jgi:hypothetical protein